MKILRVILIIIVLVAVGVIGYNIFENIPASTSVIRNTAPLSAPIINPAREIIGKPKTLIIPKLGIETNIQEAGVTAAGVMANPQGPNKFRETAWYKLGLRPGQAGSAVIGGHLDNGLSLAAVFNDLNQLKAGDTVIIKTDAEEELTFRVMDQEIYDYKNAPKEKVFNYNDGRALLNLTTCDGTWLASERNYDKRLVVYTELVSISSF